MNSKRHFFISLSVFYEILKALDKGCQCKGITNNYRVKPFANVSLNECVFFQRLNHKCFKWKKDQKAPCERDSAQVLIWTHLFVVLGLFCFAFKASGHSM